jgi:hypothetical protein
MATKKTPAKLKSAKKSNKIMTLTLGPARK